MNVRKQSASSGLGSWLFAFALGAVAGGAGVYYYLGAKVPPAMTSESGGKQASVVPDALARKDAKDYEFYGVLGQKGAAPGGPAAQTAEPTVPASTTAPATVTPAVAPVVTLPPNKPVHFQIASFKTAEDADALRARLVIVGVPASVSSADVAGQGMRYRVRIGPFADEQEGAEARAKLQAQGIDAQHAILVR